MRGDPSARPEALLSITRATARIDAQILLDRVSLEVRRGEIVTVVGPNGGGKTTLLRLATGDLAPAAGTVSRRPGLRIGYAPQSLTLDRTLPLTAARFVALAAGSDPVSRAEALDRVGERDFADRQMADLSGGQRQRALLARALARRPDLLILDEPTQGLDQNGAAGFYRLIETVRAEFGLSVLMASHELHVVMAASDHVICLNGHVCCQGAPQMVSAHPEYRRLFGAGADGALALYRHRHDHEHDAL